MATKVTGEAMTAAERRGDKAWFCQGCGGELEKKQAGDPTGQLKCSACGTSHWATLPPSAADVAERTEARERAESDRKAAFDAAKKK